jgi:hypothetical protein
VKKYTYTKKDFNSFKKSVIYWMDRFGITEFEYQIIHSQIDGGAAITTYNNKSKLACFQLTHKIKYDFCHQSDMNKLALHEVIHLLLADFGYAIHETKDFCSDLVIAHEHAVVMRLLRVIK